MANEIYHLLSTLRLSFKLALLVSFGCFTNITIAQSYNTKADRVADSLLKALPVEQHFNIIRIIPIDSPILNDIISIPPTYPYSTQVPISSNFGGRIHPIKQTYHRHSGIDIPVVNKDNNIYAPANGTVDTIGYNPRLGLYIEISHKYNYRSIYGHLDSIYVRQSQTIKKGCLIAKIGNSGQSTGLHLHFTIKHQNKLVNPMNYISITLNKIINRSTKP